MSTTVSFVNEALVDQKVVEALRYTLPYLKMFSYNIDTEEKIVNDIVYVPIATDPTEGNKTAGTLVTDSGTLAGVAVTLDTFKGAGWAFTEGTMRANLMQQAWADKAAGAVYSCAKGVIDRALALITAANFSNNEGSDKYTKAVADFKQPELAAFISAGEGKIKQREKTILLNNAYSFQIMGDSLLALAFGQAGSAFVTTGTLPNLLGIPAARYGAFPANSENLGGAMFGRAALLVGVGRPSQLISGGQGNVVERRVITDPDSGISAQYTMTVDGGGKLSGEIAMLSGVAKGQDAVTRLVTA